MNENKRCDDTLGYIVLAYFTMISRTNVMILEEMTRFINKLNFNTWLKGSGR